LPIPEKLVVGTVSKLYEKALKELPKDVIKALLNKYEPSFIRKLKVRGVIGKSGMDKATLEAMKEVGS